MKSRSNKQSKHSNRIYWAIAYIPMVIATCALILFVAIDKQPSHYEGETFTNVSTSISNTSTSTSVSSSTESIETSDGSPNTDSVYTESSNTEVLEQRGGTCMGATVGTTPAFNPTFEVEQVSSKYDLYTVKHLPTGDSTKPLTYEDAITFCAYMEQIVCGKTQLEYSMDQNFNYWKENVKGN